MLAVRLYTSQRTLGWSRQLAVIGGALAPKFKALRIAQSLAGRLREAFHEALTW